MRKAEETVFHKFAKATCLRPRQQKKTLLKIEEFYQEASKTFLSKYYSQNASTYSAAKLRPRQERILSIR
jgi:hypothetical protein